MTGLEEDSIRASPLMGPGRHICLTAAAGEATICPERRERGRVELWVSYQSMMTMKDS